MDYEYDYEKYISVVEALLRSSWRDQSNLEIGEDISDIPSVKIIFDGYGYNEETDEQDNKDLECYAVFIHNDSDKPNFVFPPHDLTPWALIHRPNEEVCIYAWYDVKNDEFSINGLDETNEHSMSDERVMEILNVLYEAWFNYPDVA